MNIVAIVQARLTSTRLPNKVLMRIAGRTLIDLLLKRLSQAKNISQIIVAIPTSFKNDALEGEVKSLGYCVFRGDDEDVLDRFSQAAKKYSADVVIRITGDCPMVDPLLVDKMIQNFLLSNVDYLSNTIYPTFPDGFDVEIFKVSALLNASKHASKKYDKEHVTPFIKNSKEMKIQNYEAAENHAHLRLTVDELKDFSVIKNVFEYFHPSILFDLNDVLDLYKKMPSLFSENISIERNEGASMGSGQKLWRRAKTIIPGGGMLLSKRAELFLPNKWPAYFSKAKGCSVWDLDGTQYTDMYLMGVGTNILGYGDEEVDESVMNVVRSGNMSSFNCPEEVLLSEKLLELHPWADMVRLARTGGEANAVAVRIARAASRKDNVAICGYHGWHDWYLSANLVDDSRLDKHLLTGLMPLGVPSGLKNSVFPFSYNNIEELMFLVDKCDVGTIKMEVSRNFEPENDFLRQVREIADKYGIILIFDECTSGFREALGGLHKKYGVEPDMAVFGKALGNGYAITAILGRREIMEAAQDTFISSTFWTERIGPTAALKCLEVMERTRSWDLITKKGQEVKCRWIRLAEKYSLQIECFGLDSMASFRIDHRNWATFKTFITQEMLANNFLAGDTIYFSVKHTDSLIDKYFELLDPIFQRIKDAQERDSFDDLLSGPIAQSGFKRVN